MQALVEGHARRKLALANHKRTRDKTWFVAFSESQKILEMYTQRGRNTETGIKLTRAK